MKLLNDSYYQKKDVLSIAKDLLGKIIVTNINNQITSGEIVETEAYNGVIDKACHAYNNRITKRTAVMYEKGGLAYVYLCYGVHHLFNIITGEKDTPHAVLIRAIRPIDGISLMLKRRKKAKLTRSLTAGPGSLSEALGIDKSFNTIKLTSEKLQIYNAFTRYLENDIIISKRVNVAYAKEDALLPYRFRVKNSSWTSLAK